ncbi:thiolase-like protein [Entophlyctis helioformis]|nr:thiolase-like protein [Entophlyctis helioformis]
MSRRRVVVTGLGLVTPLGCSVASVWQRLLAGHGGIVSLKGRTHAATGFSYDAIPAQVAALVPHAGSPDLADGVVPFALDGASKAMSPFMLYAMHAARQALADAKWAPTLEADLERTGVCVGSGIGCMDDLVTTAQAYTAHGPRKVSPYLVPRLLINMAAGHISITHGFKGPNHAASTACTTGAHAIGDAMRFIQYGDADVMVAGGAEASVSPLAMAGFAKARSLATKFNDDPSQASRPFDSSRDGFVMGEGSGVVVLEELEHAVKRGAHVYAEMRGYGLSGDAHHITAPPTDGNGAARAMRRALEVAGLEPSQIDYINAHATSTDLGDLAEARAIQSVFGSPTGSAAPSRVAVSSTKGAIGHLLGAAGAVEAIFTILAVKNNVLPPTLNLVKVDEALTGLDAVDHVALEARTVSGAGVRAAITNSFGFGGTNASLCFSKLQEQ